MVVIVRTERFDRCQEQLRRGDARAMLAACNAEEIIATLVEDGGDMMTVTNKLTWHGEARLEKGLKFDLGSGYRLISARQGNVLLFLFSGTHDECDRWLDKNRGRRFFVADDGICVDSQKESGVDMGAGEGDIRPGVDEYEQLLREKITQRELRQIFSGFYENN